MESIILVSLIILLVCTAAGLIFLAVTVSDKSDEDAARKAEEDIDSDWDYEKPKPSASTPTPLYNSFTLSGEKRTKGEKRPKSGSYTKISDIELMGKKTHIVSVDLKQDFEKTLAQMTKAPEDIAPEPEDINIETDAGTDEDLEFIDVLDIIGEDASDDSPADGRDAPDDGFSDTEDEFLIGEELLR